MKHLNDRCREYSLQFLDIVEERLHMECDEAGIVRSNLGDINQFTIARLVSDLNELWASDMPANAATDFESFGKTKEKHIQTTAIGYAPDFEALVKLGLMLGERTIMWDTIFYNLLDSRNIVTSHLQTVAISLLRLKPLVKRGGACILPHPARWLDRSIHYFSVLAKLNVTNTDFIGLVNAQALKEERITVQPYLYQQDSQRVRHYLEGMAVQPKIDQTDLDHHLGFQRFLTDERLAFVSNSTPHDFFDALATSNEHRVKVLGKLAKDLGIPLGMKNVKQKDEHFDRIIDDLKDVIHKHNHNLVSHGRKVATSRIGFVNSCIGLIAGGLPGLLTAFSGMLGLGLSAKDLISSSAAKPDQPMLYQFFSDLDDSVQQQYQKELEAVTLDGLLDLKD